MNSQSSTLGAFPDATGVRFAVRSTTATRIWVSLFDPSGEPRNRPPRNDPGGDGLHTLFVPGLKPGARYGLRADGNYDPARGDWFDPDKLLVDPYAVAIDRPYTYDPRLAARRGAGGDTAALVPKAIVSELPPALAPKPPLFSAGRADLRSECPRADHHSPRHSRQKSAARSPPSRIRRSSSICSSSTSRQSS